MNIDHLVRAIVYLTRDNPKERQVIEVFLMERESHGFRQVDWTSLLVLSDVVYDACTKLIDEVKNNNPEYFKSQEYAKLLDELNLPYTPKDPPKIVRIFGYGRRQDAIHYFNPLHWSSRNLIYSRECILMVTLFIILAVFVSVCTIISYPTAIYVVFTPILVAINLALILCWPPKRLLPNDPELESIMAQKGSPRLQNNLHTFVNLDYGVFHRDLELMLKYIRQDIELVKACVNEIAVIPGNAPEIEALESLLDVYTTDEHLVADLVAKVKKY